MSVHFSAPRPRAAPATWPYAHRSVAEIDARSARTFWTAYEDAIIRGGVRAKRTFDFIARELGNRKAETCRLRAQELGLIPSSSPNSLEPSAGIVPGASRGGG